MRAEFRPLPDSREYCLSFLIGIEGKGKELLLFNFMSALLVLQSTRMRTAGLFLVIKKFSCSHVFHLEKFCFLDN